MNRTEIPPATGVAHHLECSLCARRWPSDALAGVSPCCGQPLLAGYDLASIRPRFQPGDLRGRRSDLWRYAEVLPTRPGGPAAALGEGFTPLVEAPRLASRTGVRRLWIKNEGHNPTGSFKDRGASVALARARELGVEELAIPSSGNAGAATAAYGAVVGIRVHVFVPVGASPVTCEQIRAFGADLRFVDGSFAECGTRAAEAAERHGWFFYATLREPYRVEGKKTMAYEIVEQLGFRVPDAILYPTGGTTGFIALWKAFDEMQRLGWIGPERPRMISVQAEGCAPVVRAWERGADTIEPWDDVQTYASGLSAPTVFGDHLTLRVLRESNGAAVAISDGTMAEWVRTVGRDTGLFVSPEGGAVAAATHVLRERGILSDDHEVVFVATATGLKYVGREPRGLDRKPGGKGREPSGASREPSGASREPSGASREPSGAGRPAADPATGPATD